LGEFLSVSVEDGVVQVDVLLEVSAGNVVDVAEVEIAGHIDCQFLVNTDGS
jgi:hypothetical protein